MESATGISTVSKPKGGLPTVPILVLIAILVLLVIGLLLWALYNYQMLMNRDLTLSQNPYCIRTVCGTPGTEPIPIETPIQDDPQKRSYSTINFCTVNAPPESLTNALQTCAAGSSPVPEELESRLTDFAAFYNGTYIPSCGYTWKSSNVPVNTANPEATNPQNPTNPNGLLLNGANDPTITYLVGCADTVGIAGNPDIEALRQLCGAQCM